MAKPTIRDVAAEAKVSIATVSYVVNGTKPVSEERRARVERAIKALGYRPNALAQGLKLGISGTVAVVLSDIANTRYTLFLRGLYHKLNESGVTAFVADAEGIYEKERQHIESLTSRQVNAIVLASSRAKVGELIDAVGAEVPIVLLDSEIEDGVVFTVQPDYRSAVIRATRHLVSVGKRDIVFVGPQDETRSGKESLKGYVLALRSVGSYDQESVLYGDSSEEGGRDVTLEMLDRRQEAPEAVVAADPYMGLGVLHALYERGLAVPGDVAVVTVGWRPAFPKLWLPQPTTLEVPWHEAGVVVGQCVVDLVENARVGESAVTPSGQVIALDVPLVPGETA